MESVALPQCPPALNRSRCPHKYPGADSVSGGRSADRLCHYRAPRGRPPQ